MQKLIINRILLILMAGMCFVQKADAASSVDAAKGVVSRLLPSVSKKFQFEEIADVNGLDVFEVRAIGGIVTVKGNTAVAMCRGVYDYLKKECNCIVNWDGNQLNLPDPLPNTTNRRVVSKFKYREFLQVCTFGYTTPYWDWDRWERELDFMALHGFNMPSSEVGQEKALQNVLLSYGFTDKDIRENFFSGPAQLPWYRMGNLYTTGGPMPQSYIDFQCELQKKILARQMELGMKPIVPGFSAFVPHSFKQKFPQVQTREVEGFGQKTLQVDARDSMFAEITRKFMDEYKKLYGEHAGYYSIDLYNEMTPPVGNNAAADLAEIGGEIHSILKAADPSAVWVMMGWMFAYKPSFWTDENIEAFFTNIPVADHITLDLGAGNPLHVGWSRFPALQKRQVIWCHIVSFGGRNHFQGNMDIIVPKPYEAYNTMGADHMVGMGITPEGSENNMAMVELLSDCMWLENAPDIDEWIRAYGCRRYGTKSQNAEDIWAGIYKNLYQWQDDYYDTYKMFYLHIPRSDNLPAKWSNIPIRNHLVTMLSHGNELYKYKLYRHDLIEVARRYFGEMAGNYLIDALNSTGPAQQQHIQKFNTLTLGIDSLMANIPIYRLDNWIADARSIVPEADKDYLEKNAREILSSWWFGDYAYREWAGLVASYYRERWKAYFNGGDAAVTAFHNSWLNIGTLPEIKECDVYSKIAELLQITDSITVDPIPIINNQIKPGNNGIFSTQFGPGFVKIITNPACRYEINIYSLKGTRLRKIKGKGNKIFRINRLGLAAGLFVVRIQSDYMSQTFKVLVK